MTMMMTMTSAFAERIAKSSKLHRSRLVLALDPSPKVEDLVGFAKKALELSDHICAIKINFHLLLPLQLSEVKSITDLAHSRDIQTIADVKLNDISTTNEAALSHLWSAGFDALTVNPIIGFDALRQVIENAHGNSNGVIALVYMSHRSAAQTYGMQVTDAENRKRQMHEVFLDWAEELGADGIVVGATVPDIIRQCSSRIKRTIAIFSPGVGAQGGDVKQALANGSDYLIVGRSIIEAGDPKGEASRMQALSWTG
ncbi:MAG: orotidine 5'-phosphate decarboxylase [Nitrososphaerales archaeon]